MNNKLLPSIVFLILLAAFHFIFRNFFPTASGTMGNDYSRVLPDLLDGYYWYRNNGLFAPFWFTPSFCGGQPALGDAVSSYYSIPQFLAFFIDPVSAVYASVLLFASAGFWGSYFLLRDCFGTSRQTALLGGALFMFNGFFIHRMLAGHLIYHGMMLIPATACLFFYPYQGDRLRRSLLSGVATGGMIAYAVYSGLISLLPQFLLALFVIACLHAIAGRHEQGLRGRLLFAILIAAGLSAMKLAAVISFLGNFPRSDYPLPGIRGMWNTLYLLFSSLFLAPADIAQQAFPHMANMMWMLDRHEWEYGVTVVPLVILLAGIAVALIQRKGGMQFIRPHVIWLTMLALSLLLPVALNTYTPQWNAVLKHTPVIQSSSNLLRWFLIYIPFIILCSALVFDRMLARERLKHAVLAAALVIVVLVNAMQDRQYYLAQSYDQHVIVQAWHDTRDWKVQPHISHIAASYDADHSLIMAGNDAIAEGGSQLACYNPMFGYRLERFPVKTLHPGALTDIRNGYLNMKNPACYVYPAANNCRPGDHFTDAQTGEVEKFADYRPFTFGFSPLQAVSNWITAGTLIALITLALIQLVSRRISRRG